MSDDRPAIPETAPGPAYAKAKRARLSLDEKESQKVRKRSRGQCEVQEIALVFKATKRSSEKAVVFRCQRLATDVMHLIGGKNRGRGISALAERKLHGCRKCHRDIDGDLGGKKLIRVGGTVPHYQDVWRRVR